MRHKEVRTIRRSMNVILTVVVTCSLVLTVQHSILAQVKSKQESPPEETITQGFSIDTTIGKLLENEAARAILERHLPAAMLNHPDFEKAMAASVRQIAPYAPQILTEEKLQAIDEDLTQLR
jgi:hypothetical protein